MSQTQSSVLELDFCQIPEGFRMAVKDCTSPPCETFAGSDKKCPSYARCCKRSLACRAFRAYVTDSRIIKYDLSEKKMKLYRPNKQIFKNIYRKRKDEKK